MPPRLANGKAADNSATWGSMFKQQVESLLEEALWRIESAEARSRVAIRLKRDGSWKECRFRKDAATPYLRVYQESACARSSNASLQAAGSVFEDMKYFAPCSPNKKLKVLSLAIAHWPYR